jgi:hypothetical protein
VDAAGVSGDEAAGVGAVAELAAGDGLANGLVARADGELAGVVSRGDVALAVGAVDVLVLLAGWDWVAPCGWVLGLVRLAGALGADDDPPAGDDDEPLVAELSYRYRLYWRIRLIRLVP